MLLVALVFCLAKTGLSITYPTFDDRFNVIVDECINNVTYDGSFEDYGSIICRCGTYNVICFGYEENDCSGNVLDTISWGGCEQDATTKYLYNITGCAAAQENAANGQCTYFVEDDGWDGTSNYYSAIKPLGFCQDYNCGSNTETNSRSCRYTNDGTNITYATYSDYECSSVPTVADKDYDFSQRISGTDYVDCGVTVTRYSVSNNNYYCGSKDSKISVNPKTPVSKNYLMESVDSIPQSIGVCLSQRNGFHEYSWKYECNEDQDMVYRRIYLNSDSCRGVSYIAQNYSSLNYTVVCSGKSAKGKYGYYGNGCADQNWDASYYESPKLYGQCIPFRTDPQATSTNPNDGSLYQNQPWQSNLRIVHSCANMKGWDYEAHFFFATSDCTGDYLFRVDEDNEYSAYQDDKQYPCKNTLRTKITGCSGGVNINKKGRILLG